MNKILLLAALLAAPLTCAAAAAPPPAATHSNAVVEYLKGKGLTVKDRFSVPGGLIGYSGLTPDGKHVVFYTTADGSVALFGALLDAHGHSLSQAYQNAYVQQPKNQKLFAHLEKAHWISAGSKHPRRIVYAFIDPDCPYCWEFWKAAQHVYGHGVQVRYMIVGILGDSSIKKAAAILGAKDPQAALEKNESGFQHHSGAIKPMSKVPDKLRSEIADHNRLMQQFGLDGTPGLVWKDAQGTVETSNGLPPDNYLQEIFGLDDQRK
ncbi:MAG: thiol:disulfide interchange protein DsbG [Gammaproteobacteria bacterium]